MAQSSIGPAVAPPVAVPSLAARLGMRRGGTSSHAVTAWLMVLPSVLFFCVFVLYPVGNAFYVSFTSWDLVSPPRFIGLRNYQRLLTDAGFLHSAWVTVYYSAVLLFFELPISLGLAVLLDRKIKGRAFYQAVIFSPAVLTLVVVALLWRVVLAPVGGLFEVFTAPFGLTGVQWLNDRNLAMPAVIMVSLWKNVGYYMVIFLAGLQAIPSSYYEAARLDGASSWALFRHITLPLLRPFLLFVTVVSVIKASQAFSLFYALTNGGPADATKVVPYLIYDTAFGFNRMGYASAMAMLMFVALLILTAIQFRLLRPQAGEGA
jgi:multiple sugar transport system permease protein